MKMNYNTTLNNFNKWRLNELDDNQLKSYSKLILSFVEQQKQVCSNAPTYNNDYILSLHSHSARAITEELNKRNLIPNDEVIRWGIY
jgi:hypothetical protein